MTPALGIAPSAARWTASSALIAAGVLSFPFLIGGVGAVRASFQDDAFYYAGIARNVAQGHGVTFDGLHATSGFHPLWLGVLVPVFAMLPGLVPPLIASAILQIGLASAAAALTTATLARVVDRWSALAGGTILVALPGTGATLTGGLEGSLALCAVVFGWRIWWARAGGRNPASSSWLGPGIVFALAGLARLEAFLFVPVAFVVAFWGTGRRGRSAVALCAPAAAAAVGVVAASRVLTGTWLPISAAVKAAGRAQRIGEHRLPIAIGGALAVLAITILIVCARRAAAGATSRAIACLAAGASLWIAADLLSVGRLEPWNRVPVLLLGAAGVAALAPLRRGAAVAVVVALVAMLRVPVALARGSGSASPYAPYRWAAGLWLRDHLDADARIGSWNAGTIGYVSERHVVNLDGLVNDRAYLDEVLRGKALEAYLGRERITWIVDQACGIAPSLDPYLVRTGSQAIARRATLVATMYDPTTPDGCPGVAIWQLGAD